MLSGKMTFAITIATLTALLAGACYNTSSPSTAAQRTQQTHPTAQSTGTNWHPTWDTSPDKSKTEIARLRPTFRLAGDGFRGSPIFENQEQKKKNAQTRETIARSLPSIPECSGIELQPQNSKDAGFVLQLFNGIDGRSGRLQWVLYRADTLGERAHGEGTGADTVMGQIGIAEAVCSAIGAATNPTGPMTAEIHPSLEEWEASSQSVETQFSHFHYRLPQGFKALPDETRRKENLDQFQTQRAKALKKQGQAQDSHRPEGGQQIMTTNKTEIFPIYTLLLAARTAPTASEANQLPRATIFAHRRIPMMMEAGDPAKFVMYVPQVKVLRGPENVMLSGRNFVRTDFKFKSGSLLSKFCTVDGDYLFEFDFRSDNEKDLGVLVQSMQSIAFRP
jgi:hypothetical protein